MISNALRYNSILSGLRRRWSLIALIYGGVLPLGFFLLQPIRLNFAARWTLVTGLVLAYQLWLLWRGLARNHRSGESELLASFGWGNQLTLLRGLAISMVAGFLFSPWPSGFLAWLPAILYALAGIADYLDGYLARIRDQATLLGAHLDIEFDALGMLVVSFLGVWYEQLPWWYALLGAARYFFIGSLWWREKRRLPVYDIPPSVHRRIIAGFQMGFMSAVLWPILPVEGLTIAGSVFALATTVSFLRDWLIASGRIDASAPVYQRGRRRLYVVVTRLLPPLLRLFAVVTMGLILVALPQLFAPSFWTSLLASWNFPRPHIIANLMSGISILATIALGLGAMGRVAAFLLVFPIGFDMIIQGLTLPNGIALTAVTYLMMFGSGAFSLWQPEERFMVRRAGKSRDEGKSA